MRGAGIGRLPLLTLDLSSSIIWPWSALYHITLQQLSRSETLNYDHYGRPFPDIPARQCFIELRRELLWHDTQSFVEWVIS